MSGASTTVTNAFTTAQSYAQGATTQANSFLASFANNLYAAPSLDFQWSSPSAPAVTEVPVGPVLANVAYVTPSEQPEAFSVAAPNIAISTFAVEDPLLTIPSAPNLTYGTVPSIPSIGDVAVPNAPVVTLPDTPTYVPIAEVSLVELETYAVERGKLIELSTAVSADQIAKVAELVMVAPTPYSYAPGPKYVSDLQNMLQSKLLSRFESETGTGLTPAIEQALWQRSRDRETQIALANEADVTRTSEALGFELPPGVLAAQIRTAQQNYYDKLSGLSRDISIKQAEMEQKNLFDAIAQGTQLEQQLVDYSYKIERLSFDVAKEYADNAIKVHTEQVAAFNALQEGFKTFASVFKTLLEAEMQKVEIYKAQLSAEQTKAQINTTLVQQYKAQVEASMAQVEIYRAQVGGAQTLVQLEQAKIGAAGEQIRGYVAQVNAETAKVEAYKAQVQGEATKADIYRAKTQALSAKVSAEAEAARVNVASYSAQAQAYAARWDGYKTKIAAEMAKMQAIAAQNSSLIDGYKAASASAVASAEVAARMWEADLKQYEQGKNLALQTDKINTDILLQTNRDRLDASKVGAQVFAQLASSAYGMVHAQAGINGSDSMSVSYSYSNDTDSTVPPVVGFTV